MGKYEIVDSNVKGHKYIRFDSIKSFYYYTRGKRHKSLVDDLKTNIKYTGATEPDSWEQSLPDLAKLLYDPQKYHEGMKNDVETYKKNSELLYSDLIKQVESDKRFETYAKDHLKNFVEKALKPAFNGDRKSIRTDACTFFNSLRDIDNLEVFLEYPLKSKGHMPKRADVILHRKTQTGEDKYVILELKQYSWDYLPTTKMPWDQINEYVEQFNEEHHANATGLIYMHNQLYYNSELYKMKKEQGIYDNNMYTKGFCGTIANRIFELLN